MSKATLYPSRIVQPNAHEKNPIDRWCFKEVRRGGGVYDYGCSSPYDPRYYHEWTNTGELKSGGEAQCGRPSTSSCSHSVEYGIAGYRNTCPIAGCNGTYNAPATLQLYYNARTLAAKGMKIGAKVSSITVSFQHRCTGVDVSDGREYTSWGPNFDGYHEYPDLNVLQLYFTNKNGKRISKIVTKDSHGNKFSNPPLDGYGVVTAEFTDVTYDELKGGALNIVYGRNLSTNPGNIYIRHIKTKVTYTNPPTEPTLKGEASGTKLITSNYSDCRTSITHTITAIKPDKKAYNKDNILITKSKSNISVDFIRQDGTKLYYKITDTSNTAGKKAVTYKIKNTSKSVKLEFTSSVNPKPEMKMNTSIKQYSRTQDISGSSIKFINGCTSHIYIYADGLTNNHLIKHVQANDMCASCKSTNLLKDAVVKEIMKKISELSCGIHKIYYRFDTTSTAKFQTIEVIPRHYEFKMFIDTENEQEFNFVQDKDNHIINIKIQRTDNETPSITPKFQVEETTLLRHRIPNSSVTSPFELSNNVTKNIPISIYLPGIFSISIKEVNDANKNCTLAQDIRTINVTPSHNQYHDSIFVRGEDSTSFDYDYLVAWEGDDIKQPIDVDDIELICSYDDLKLCVDAETTIGLSQTGLARIRVLNDSKNELDFQNINLELNILKFNDYNELEVTTDEYFNIDGMLLNFESNFKMYNKDISDNVSIHNLSEDDDLEEEENVYINIKELLYGDSIVINIPFLCRSAKDIYCQLLIFGEPMELHSFLNCNSEPFEYMHLRTYDSIQTDMQIIGETDLLKPNIDYDFISGETINQCPNECFNTKTYQNQPLKIDENTYNGGITYKIKNIDSNAVEDAKTIIKNDVNLIPVGLVYHQDNEDILLLFDENYVPDKNNKIYWERKEIPNYLTVVNGIIKMYVNFPNTEEEIYIQRTDKKGNVSFQITIPNHEQKYTIQELLENVITIFYEGNDENKEIVLGKTCDSVNQILTAHEVEMHKKITQLTQIKNSLPQNSTQALTIQNTINKLSNNDKNQTILNVVDTYRKYKPGQIVNLNINLQTKIIHLDNYIVFKPDILYPGQEDEITVFYNICNLDNNQGILNTTFKTDLYTLIPHEISKDIYCGIETNLYSKTRIEKRVVEQNTFNVIHVYIYNKIRDNHDIVCKIDLGPYPEVNLDGVYDFVNMSINDGDYNIEIDDTNHVIIEWNIGEMKADTNTQSTIILKGKEVGLSEILIDTFDYLHNEEQTETYNFASYACNCRE